MFCCGLGEEMQVRLIEAWHDVEKHVQITWQVTGDPSELLSFLHSPFYNSSIQFPIEAAKCVFSTTEKTLKPNDDNDGLARQTGSPDGLWR